MLKKYNRINILGQEFYLVPCEEIDSFIEEPKDIIDGYSPIERVEEDPELKPIENAPVVSVERRGIVQKAVGVLSDYRERFKQHKISLSELRTTPQIPHIPSDPTEGEFRKISQAAGGDVWFGDGTEIDE